MNQLSYTTDMVINLNYRRRMIKAFLVAGILSTGTVGFLALVTDSSKGIMVRVGTKCRCRDCKKVVEIELEEYVARTLPKEWYRTWHIESLKAGAIAVRSYATWRIHHPVRPEYDICNTECCQVTGDERFMETDKAVAETAGVVLVDLNGYPTKTSYSAEGNGTGCADGFMLNDVEQPCLEDAVCKGTVRNGHGIGMCQWGSQRWANTGKSYKWILSHYYSRLKLINVQELSVGERSE